MSKQKRLNSLESLRAAYDLPPIEEKPDIPISKYGQPFFGRDRELQELQSFIKDEDSNGNSNIFCLYGIPMIGKTKLVNEFIKREKTFREKKYNKLFVEFGNENQDLNPERQIEEYILGKQKISELKFDVPTLIKIENFHECLEWIGNQKTLHNIKVKYPKISSFLKKVAVIPNVKVILISRFQLNTPNLNIDVSTLSEVELKGVDPNLFWNLYEKEGVNRNQFDTICEQFSNHTGLLAYAYRFKGKFYRNILSSASYRPQSVTESLWSLLDDIIYKLRKNERLVLFALTIDPTIALDQLEKHLGDLREFRVNSVTESIYSLDQKFLIYFDTDDNEYKINPYIREICYTKLQGRREMNYLLELPYFKQKRKPRFNKLEQTLHNNKFGLFYREIKQMETNGKWEEAIEILRDTFVKNPVINKAGVLNEIGTIYRKHGYLEEAKKTFDEALQIESRNIKVLTELSIAFKTEKDYNAAIEILEIAHQIKSQDQNVLNELGINFRNLGEYSSSEIYFKQACELGNRHSFSELYKTYIKMNDLISAEKILLEGIKKHPSDRLLRVQLLELQKRKTPKKIIEKNNSSKVQNPSFTEILMLTANPSKTAKLNLDIEHSRITTKLQDTVTRFNFKRKKAVNATEFKEIPEIIKPHILHFSGHGKKSDEELKIMNIDTGGLMVQNEDKNGYDILTSEALEILFGYFKTTINLTIDCVVLNACYSENQANAISKYVPFVIATTKDIDDNHAISFSTGFYFKLAQKDPIDYKLAFESGKAQACVKGAKKEDFILFQEGKQIF